MGAWVSHGGRREPWGGLPPAQHCCNTLREGEGRGGQDESHETHPSSTTAYLFIASSLHHHVHALRTYCVRIDHLHTHTHTQAAAARERSARHTQEQV